MRVAQLALLSLVTQSLPAWVAAQAPATTKVESQVVATGEAGMQFIVSPRMKLTWESLENGSRSCSFPSTMKTCSAPDLAT